MSIRTEDLTKEAPASPADRVGHYVILARLADKARAAFLGGKIGPYDTDCPLDHMLLDWKGVTYAEIKKEIVRGADNAGLAAYLDSHGTPKTPEEAAEWSDAMEEYRPGKDPERRDWFAVQCNKLDLDSHSTTLFEWLDADDEESFQ